LVKKVSLIDEQTRLESFVEASLNTASGFLLSFVAWITIVVPFFGLPFDIGESFGITCFFTVLSVARSYAWRRFFNRRVHRQVHKWMKEFYRRRKNK